MLLIIAEDEGINVLYNDEKMFSTDNLCILISRLYDTPKVHIDCNGYVNILIPLHFTGYIKVNEEIIDALKACKILVEDVKRFRIC